MIALLIVAVALGLNNFGAAIAIGVSGVDRRTEIKVATVFGLCDVVMPATGMLIGTGLAGPLGSAARWAGAGILFVTAVWGLAEALRGGEDAPAVWHGWRLLVSGAALSLDDLAVGLALGTVRYPIVLAVTLFGLMSFVMSVIGLKLGRRLGTAAGEHGEVVGAIVLIGISGAMAMGWLLPRSAGQAGVERTKPATAPAKAPGSSMYPKWPLFSRTISLEPAMWSWISCAHRGPQMKSCRPTITSVGVVMEFKVARSSITTGAMQSSRPEIYDPLTVAAKDANSSWRPQ
jgi:manganese efflux pump family protein